MRRMCFVLLLILSPSVSAIDSCQEIFSKEIIESIETHPVDLMNGGVAQKVIVNYQNGISISVLKDLPVTRWRFVLYVEMFRSVFQLGGRVVQFGVKEAIENSPRINCHTYACLKNEIPGLPHGWIDGARSMGTFERRSPMRVVLESFFEKIKDLNKEDERILETDTSLREGDVVHYVDAEGKSVHSGLLIKRSTLKGRRFWVRSKIGELMTIDLKPQKMGAIYDYEKIEVWRRFYQD